MHSVRFTRFAHFIALVVFGIRGPDGRSVLRRFQIHDSWRLALVKTALGPRNEGSY